MSATTPEANQKTVRSLNLIAYLQLAMIIPLLLLLKFLGFFDPLDGVGKFLLVGLPVAGLWNFVILKMAARRRAGE